MSIILNVRHFIIDRTLNICDLYFRHMTTENIALHIRSLFAHKITLDQNVAFRFNVQLAEFGIIWFMHDVSYVL